MVHSHLKDDFMYVAYDSDKILRAISNKPFKANGQSVVKVSDEIPREDWSKIIGKRIVESDDPQQQNSIRVAILCNWKDKCGIATYSGYLVDSLRPKVKEIRIFSENNGNPVEEGVEACWKRGESMRETITKVLAWKPDFVIIQHEYGIFPNAFHYLQMVQMLEKVPYIVVMHSVYEHLDKAICTGVTRNIVVHSQAGKDLLLKLGNNCNIDVIPHGCIVFDNIKELWNTFRNPYTIVQFGFGFYYKGMDRAIDAINYLKNTDSKFKNICYCCLVSINDHNLNIHNDYYNYLISKIETLNLQDNVTIQRKYFSEDIINYFLRTCKIALFPYKVDPNNTVYGASGAVRIAMANGIPVICSESHLFDDLEGVIPRPNDYLTLAKEIDEIFSNDKYRQKILERSKEFITKNSWDNIADMYLDMYTKIWKQLNNNNIKLAI